MTTESEESKREKVRSRLLSHMPKNGIAAEIGVWEGKFSRKILLATEPRELHLIDPWLYQPEFANTGFAVVEVYDDVVTHTIVPLDRGPGVGGEIPAER